jgi:hypothetical protein
MFTVLYESRSQGVLVSFVIAMTQYLTKNNLKGGKNILLQFQSIMVRRTWWSRKQNIAVTRKGQGKT